LPSSEVFVVLLPIFSPVRVIETPERRAPSSRVTFPRISEEEDCEKDGDDRKESISKDKSNFFIFSQCADLSFLS
jgi:hypothetical protein